MLDSVGASAGDAEILLHQESNERWILDPGPEWQISKQEVIVPAGAAPPRTEAFMHRDLAGKPMAHSFLPMPECILQEAWTEGNCVPRQLAALLQVPLSEVEWEIEQQNSGWCEKKVSHQRCSPRIAGLAISVSTLPLSCRKPGGQEHPFRI